MRKKELIPILLAGLMVIATACSSTKGLKIEKPAWHTCYVPKAQMRVAMGKDEIETNVQIHTVCDSLIIIGIAPLLGIEIATIEVTPDEVCFFDKALRRYVCLSLREVNMLIEPNMRWQDWQAIASGEDQGEKSNPWTFHAAGKTITLQIQYNDIQHDVHVRTKRIQKDNYRATKLTEWL